ncbi:hypothetical protein [Thalassobacillus hwangdonensis]|uniref:hypothetical protein n=1 Tax=Thalassobacillus hwangdonensis TaxID=546108 RepID=UPI0036DE3C94
MLAAILYILVKLKIVRLNSFTGKSVKTTTKLSTSFKKINGIQYNDFLLKKDHNYVLHYDVELEEGSLDLLLRGKGKTSCSSNR